MIDTRLQKVMAMVRPNAGLPIIIEVAQITPSIKQDLQSRGVTIVRSGSLLPFIYGNASVNVINSLQKMGGIIKISYDEPTYPYIEMNPPSLVTTKKIVINKKVIVTLGETVTHIGAKKMWDDNITGKGIRIGVIDTGVSTQHPTLSKAIKGTHCAVPGEKVEDNHGHGSWCCSAAGGRHVVIDDMEVVGVAPDADIYALKSLSDKGVGQMSWVMQCIEHAVTEMKCDVLSMSLGSLFDNAGVDPISRLVNEVTWNHNVPCAVAAGNSFVPMTIGSPGGALFAITVGATSLKLPEPDMPATFSSKGPTTAMTIKPDISAPGGNIVNESTAELILGAGAHGGYATMAGSSMATPQVAGALALLIQADRNLIKMKYTREYFEQLMQMSCFPQMKDMMRGYGVINIPKMYQSIDKISPEIAQARRAMYLAQMAVSAPLSLLVDTEERDRTWVVRLPESVMG